MDEPVDIPGEDPWKMLHGQAHVGELRVDDPTRDFVSLIVKDRGLRHEFGDTKYRLVQYRAVATTRFKEYFPEGTTPLTRESDWVSYPVLNSARPAAPRVLYVVPTFAWETSADGTKVVRRGGGLRVYMERPWFSSGDGELLGVLLWPGPAPQSPPPPPGPEGRAPVAAGSPSGVVNFIIQLDVPDRHRPYVSQWGMDPIWQSRPVPDLLTPQHFKRAVPAQVGASPSVWQTTGLSLDEVPGAGVTVVPHAVAYDETRRLWYCDIEIDAGPSYYPFVRLALARYQPNSVSNAHLSRVVLADFAQLAPDRTASMTFTDDTHIRVSVVGPAYAASSAGKGTSEMEVSVETSRPDVQDSALGWFPVPSAVFQLETVALSDPGQVVWVGTVQLPAPRGSKPFRLVIREYERFSVDSSETGTQTDRRLVYDAVLGVGGGGTGS